MKTFKKLSGAFLALSLVAAPTLAVAAPALKAAPARVAAPVSAPLGMGEHCTRDATHDCGGTGGGGWLLGLLAAAAAVAAIAIASGGSTKPVSP